VFGLYVANFGSYANTYGAVGGVVVLMLWFYLTALMLLLAAEVTSLLAADHEPSTLDARRAETGAHGAARAAKKAATEGLDPDVPDAADPTGEGTVPVSRAPRPVGPAAAPAGYAPPVVGPRQVLAIVFVAGAAVVGALAGLLPGRDDDGDGAASA
jgi:membrane protein